ncbi:hypothetical protein L228DRAFT_55849 [Xylona heveae TC161]|uniref:Uncharacterized protein n=1 Tax=Xylona heveae (strain CBS 132557 / TC161) TaxID=1328760 RepID=A0A164ZBX2_XYLHT|nr:hypothetical protein L228DRAFT_55849 [Xylona heveae TC161]KZF18911.1 hypothetical protein L228DRAFT_55849 [Xylona heveae TC161]
MALNWPSRFGIGKSFPYIYLNNKRLGTPGMEKAMAITSDPFKVKHEKGGGKGKKEKKKKKKEKREKKKKKGTRKTTNNRSDLRGESSNCTYHPVWQITCSCRRQPALQV